MGISRRKYAEHRGVRESAVRKAIRAGRITVEADGTIDPVKADADWARQTDPAMQRGPHSHRQGARTAAETAAAPAMKPVPRTAIRAVDETLRESGEGEASQTSFMRARMANEVLKAQIARERLKEMKGESVDRARAVAMVFDLARRERDGHRPLGRQVWDELEAQHKTGRADAPPAGQPNRPPSRKAPRRPGNWMGARKEKWF